MQQDDIESISTIGHHRRSSVSDSIYGQNLSFGGGSAVIETLQSTLKQRDGEIHQLQWQLSRLQCERNFLMSEVSSLNAQMDSVSLLFDTN